jgi:ABC-type Fe3+ transport system permease subunit
MNWTLLQNSLVLAAGVTCLAAGMGLAAALFHLCLPPLGRSLIRVLAVVSLAWPPFFVANCWLELLSPGTVIRDSLGVNPFTLGGTLWILALLLWPITFLMVSGAWARLQPSLLETDLCVRGWSLFRAILLPNCTGSLRTAALLTFVLAINNFSVPAILQVKVLPAEVWIAFSTLYQPGSALLLGLPLILLPTAFVLFLQRGEIQWPCRGAVLPPTLVRQQLGRVLVVCSGLSAVALCFMSAVLPAGTIVLDPGTWSRLRGAIAAAGPGLWNSIWQPVVAASVLCGLALLLSIRVMAVSQPRQTGRSRMFAALLWAPFFAPGVMLGITLIWLLNRPGVDWLYQSMLVIVLGLVIRYAAVAWAPIRATLRGADPALVGAAWLDGASKAQILRHVLWPSLLPNVAAVWYVIFLLVLWDVETLLLLYPPGGETLSFSVFNFLHYGHAGEVNAICLLLGVIATCPLLAWHLARYVRSILRAPSWRPLFLVGTSCLVLLTGCSRPDDKKQVQLDSTLFESARTFGNRGAGVGQFNKPRSVAVDTNDCVYAVDMTGRVQKFDSNGVYQLSWQMPQTELGKPKGMARGHDGEILVIEPHYQRIGHFSTDGKLQVQWGRRGTNAGEFMLPRAVGINSHQEAYVSEYTAAERVQWFSKYGERLLGVIGHAGDGPGEFNRPEGLCVDKEDHVYVADSCNHRIQVFSREGKFLRAFGKPGKGRGELSYPYDVCVDSAGRQYVCEFGNSRIQVFDPNGQSLEIIGGPGTAPGQFSNPWGIALDSAENLWVADSLNHRLQKLTRRHTASTSRS